MGESVPIMQGQQDFLHAAKSTLANPSPAQVISSGPFTIALENMLSLDGCSSERISDLDLEYPEFDCSYPNISGSSSDYTSYDSDNLDIRDLVQFGYNQPSSSHSVLPIAPTLAFTHSFVSTHQESLTSNVASFSQLLFDRTDPVSLGPYITPPASSSYLTVLEAPPDNLSFTLSLQSHCSTLGNNASGDLGQAVYYPPLPIAYQARWSDVVALTKRIRETFSADISSTVLRSDTSDCVQNVEAVSNKRSSVAGAVYFRLTGKSRHSHILSCLAGVPDLIRSVVVHDEANGRPNEESNGEDEEDEDEDEVFTPLNEI